MRAPSKRIFARLLAAALFACVPAFASAAETGPDNQSRIEQLPGSSRCLAECVVMEERCEELENQFPACGTDDICLVEREQCDAKCRLTALTCPPGGLKPVRRG